VKLYLDLDGVLADFDAGVVALTGKRPGAQSARAMWRQIARAPAFFATLAFTRDGEELWAFCRPLRPTILTGLPMGGWAAPQKRRWVAAKLGADVPVITGMARDKPLHSGPGRVLVDDRPGPREGWERRGGVFILHEDARRTIAALRALGLGAAAVDGR
jgi:hypothetical protein